MPRSNHCLRVLLLIAFSLAASPRIPAQSTADELNAAGQTGTFGGGDGYASREVDVSGLAIEGTIGWDGFVAHGNPVPLSFLITNSSERLIRGRLVLIENAGRQSSDLGEVVVSPGASRRFTAIRDMVNWSDCAVEFRVGGRVVWRREIPYASFIHDMDQIHNYGLLIDPSGRRLPPSVEEVQGGDVPPAKGRWVRWLAAKPWQVPDHPGALSPVQAIVFPDGADVNDLDRVQWRALADWLCLGGTVFLHEGSTRLADRLLDFAPLIADPPETEGTFTVQRVGFGAIYRYREPLFADAVRARDELTPVVARLGRIQLAFGLDLPEMDLTGSQTSRSGIMLLSFVILYALLAGLGSSLFVRAGSKKIAIYVAAVVATASLGAVVVGATMRLAPGDLRWATVTHAGPRGAVQYGMFSVQSAGGENARVTIQGERPDLQQVDRESMSRGYAFSRRGSDRSVGSGHFPFDFRPDRIRTGPDSAQIDVPVTAWGIGHLCGTGFQKSTPPIDFKIDFEPQAPPPNALDANAGKPDGTILLRVENRLPVELTECCVCIGVTGKLVKSSYPARNSPSFVVRVIKPDGSADIEQEELVDLYQVVRVPDLAPGGVHQQRVTAAFSGPERREVLKGRLDVPRIRCLGDATAWIAGVLKKSPNLRIDREGTDFVPDEGVHFFIQEIEPGDMAEAKLFLGSAEASMPAKTEFSSQETEDPPSETP